MEAITLAKDFESVKEFLKGKEIPLTPVYHRFDSVGESIEGYFMGFYSIRKTDVETGEYRDIPAVAILTENYLAINAGANLVRQFQGLNLPRFAKVKIKYVGYQSKDNRIKNYQIFLLFD